MNRVRCRWTVFSMVIMLLAIGLPVAGAGPDDPALWPLNAALNSRVDDDLNSWTTHGDVKFWNTRDELKIFVAPEGYDVAEVNIHIVQDPADFDAVLKKGKPVAGWFDYRTDYEDGGGPLPATHLQQVSLDNFDICWGMNEEQCPPNLYIIVHVELAGLGEASFAEGDGIFPRLDRDDGSFWTWYVVYPLAKVEPGHFVDANVSGLAYETLTQEGLTTDDGETGEEGHFWFLPAENIRFWVGDLYLGQALADRNVSPVDLFEGSDMDDDRVINMAWLLQSLDGDGNPGAGAIDITEPVVGCLNGALPEFEPVDFADVDGIGGLIAATRAACAGVADLATLTRDEAHDNLVNGQLAGNLMKKNVSKNPGMKADKAKLEIMPVYVPATTSDESPTVVTYYDADGEFLEQRDVAKPIIVSYVEEVDGTATEVGGKNASDVFVAISRDDGVTWKRRNISKTADKSSKVGYPGESQKPMLKVKDNMIFVAWTDKYCRGGRPAYAINLCDDPATEIVETPETGCAVYCTGNPDEVTQICTVDYPGDDAYWNDDLFGVGGPQRTVIYEDYPEMGEVPFSCVWAARGIIEPDTGDIVWFKPERVTSGRRDAYQLFAGAGEDVAFAIVWQEDPKGLMPGEGDGPGEGWSGANTNNKTDIWLSYITEKDFAKIDADYPVGGHGDNVDLVDTDDDLAGRVKALVPMSLPVRVSDNDICSAENMDPEGGQGEHDFDEEGQGTHRYCGTLEGIGTVDAPGSNPLCAYTIEKANPNGEIHNVCVTADGRFLDGNTGASRANVFVQPYKKPDGTKSAWVIIGYEESKGVGIPPDGDHDDDGCGGGETTDGVVVVSSEEDEHDTKYKPDVGKNVIYHSFDLFNPETVSGGAILNLPETDAAGNPVYVLNEDGTLMLDWKGEPILAYENARRVRFIPQPKSKMGDSGTVLVALYRQGEEGSGKPADVFMRRASVLKPDGSVKGGNPYDFANFKPGAQNVSSVTPTELFQDPFDAGKPEKMLRWSWSPANLDDKSGTNPRDDALADRGALEGDDLIIAYSWTPNWGRNANDKYDLYVRRSFDGGQTWTTDPSDAEPIEHNVVFRVPVLDFENQVVSWDEEVVTTTYYAGDSEPPRNVSNLRNNRVSVLEPRLVKTPGDILTDGIFLYPEDSHAPGVFQVAYGLEFNQNQEPNDATFPKMPLDIYYSRTLDRGQRFDTVIVTPQDGGGKPQEGWNPLAKDKPQQGAAQIRQTSDGSRMYAVWLEEGDEGSDIMFRRVDYR